MRVVLTYMSGNPSFSGGVDQVVITRARWLAEKGNKVEIVCQGDVAFDKPYEPYPGVTVHPVLVPKVLGKRTGVFHPTLGHKIANTIRDLCASSPVDLVDIHDSPLARALAPTLTELMIASTYTIHSATEGIPTKRPLPLQRYLLENERRAARTVDLCLAVSHSVAEAARSTTAVGAPIKVTPNSLPPDLTSAYPRKIVRSEANVPLKLLFAARLHRVKGLDVLLRALAQIENPGRFRLLALGAGPEGNELAEFVKHNNLESIVTFGGHVSNREELIEVFLDADVYVSPTRYEALSISSLEAIACGTPCVLSRIAPCEEVGGENAHYFTPDDPSDLASVLDDLEGNRSRLPVLSAAARTQAENFMPSRVLPLVVEGYAEAIERRGARSHSMASSIQAGEVAPRPKISVIIPAYNVEAFIVDAIRSAQNQTIVPDEIIVSDDGSTDATVRLAEETGATVVRGARGNGSIARNRGAAVATGDLLFFLDGDDWWHPYKVALHLAAHHEGPDSSFVYDCAKVVQNNGISVGSIGRQGGSTVGWRHFLDWRSWTSGSSFSVRRDRYWAIGGFNESLIALQDVDFWIRAAHTHGDARHLATPLTFYRVLPRSVSKTPRNVAENLNTAMVSWFFASQDEKKEFATQAFLTAARWCDLKTGVQHLAGANWPIHKLKFWKVVTNMTLNSSLRRNRS